jgi:carbonic anhydrase
VVRTAGQAVNELVIASADFAPRAFGTSLIVVLGHQRCAAVQLTIDAIQNHGGLAAGQDHAIVRALHPAYNEALRQRRAKNPQTMQELVTVQQTLLAAHRLRTEPSLAAKIAKRELAVVAAQYDLDSGLVAALD